LEVRKSDSILGEIFRRTLEVADTNAAEIIFKLRWRFLGPGRPVDPRLGDYPGQEEHIANALKARKVYTLQVRSFIGKFGLATELELLSNCILPHALTGAGRGLRPWQQGGKEAAEKCMEAMRALRKQMHRIFWDGLQDATGAYEDEDEDEDEDADGEDEGDECDDLDDANEKNTRLPFRCKRTFSDASRARACAWYSVTYKPEYETWEQTGLYRAIGLPWLVTDILVQVLRSRTG
jgi:hypothetical protein